MKTKIEKLIERYEKLLANNEENIKSKVANNPCFLLFCQIQEVYCNEILQDLQQLLKECKSEC